MSEEDILIVDDTVANLTLLSQMLTSQGYSVRAVTSGARALESARLLPPDLILLDIRMPGMSGFEVCEQLKSREATRDIPVIFISALDDVRDKVHGFQVGGIDYITKPFQLEEVLVRTRTHLAMRSLQHQLQEANRKMALELALAGQMQRHFMPGRLPQPPGWELTASLQPARETSGDFYNAFTLPNDHVALLIADVVDKGVGAALFMAYCCSLLRTTVGEHPDQPARVFNQINQHLLADTTTHQFVTLFYGLLNTSSGMLSYCNAGHLPPLLFSAKPSGSVRKLLFTGMPLGIEEDATWQEVQIQVDPGDLLLLYTDGVTDATNSQQESFGEGCLIDAMHRRLGEPVQKVQQGLLADLQSFVGESDQFDDIALLLVRRLG